MVCWLPNVLDQNIRMKERNNINQINMKETEFCFHLDNKKKEEQELSLLVLLRLNQNKQTISMNK